MSEHTPGPWKRHEVSKDDDYPIDIFDQNDNQVASVLCDMGNRHMQQDEVLANANLIASAPELLDIVKTVLGCIEEGQPFHCSENNRILLDNLVKKAESRK